MRKQWWSGAFALLIGLFCALNAGLAEAGPLSVCGNSVVEQGEECDDGNTNSGDGCSDQCQNEILRGDCNSTGGLDAGDPICTILCLIGNPPPGADCVDAANCNCLGGVDAGDPICAIRRLIGNFDPDSCLQ